MKINHYLKINIIHILCKNYDYTSLQLLCFDVNYLQLHIIIGMCLEEPYDGRQGTLEITIKKDGEMAGKVDIDYVG